MTITPELAALFLPFRAGSAGAQLLRVGVALDSEQPSPWVDALLGFLRQIPHIDVCVLTTADRGASDSKTPPWLAERLYSASQARYDPFGEMARNATDSPTLESVDTIRAAGCDVIVWLSRCLDPGVDLRSLAKHGIFTVRLGQQNRVFPFWDEVANHRVTSDTTIFWHDCSFAQGRAVRKAETSTSQGLFITVNAEEPLVAAIRMLAALCIEIQSAAAQFEERVRGLANEQLATIDPRYPSNFEAAQFISKKLLRSAYLRYSTRGKHTRWFVAMRPNSGGSVTDPAALDLTGFNEVPLPMGVGEMADPFLWSIGGKQYLLFEEIAAGQSRGRLGCVEVLQNGSCSDMKIILERPYHLSYPCVVPSGGDLFLLPETAEAKRIDIYRFSRFPWEVELISSPIEGVALVDTTPVRIDDRWYFFTTTTEPFMESLLFSAPRLEGPWSLHPCNPVSTSVRSCRSAGQLFWREGRLFRPTQDCSVRYGYAIAVNEVTRLTQQEFEERPVSYVSPSWKRGLVGTHTWNESSEFQVIDGLRYAQ